MRMAERHRPSTASISVNEDGTVSLLTGSVDISGSDTSLASIAAEALGIGLGQVIVAKRDTDMAPFTGPSGGSRIVYSQGKAVELAAADARNKLVNLAADRLGVPQDALICAEGRVYVQDNPPQGMTLGQLASLGVNSRSGRLPAMRPFRPCLMRRYSAPRLPRSRWTRIPGK